jgi:hypothetical protein
VIQSTGRQLHLREDSLLRRKEALLPLAPAWRRGGNPSSPAVGPFPTPSSSLAAARERGRAKPGRRRRRRGFHALPCDGVAAGSLRRAGAWISRRDAGRVALLWASSWRAADGGGLQIGGGGGGSPAGGGGGRILRLDLAVRGGGIPTESGPTAAVVEDLPPVGGAPAPMDGSAGLACGPPGIGQACGVGSMAARGVAAPGSSGLMASWWCR